MHTLTNFIQHSSGSVLLRVTRQEKEIKCITNGTEEVTLSLFDYDRVYMKHLKLHQVETIKINISKIAGYEPSEREQSHVHMYQKIPAINLTKKQKHLYSHGLHPRHRIWVQISAHPLTCRVTQDRSHNGLRRNIFNCKIDTDSVSPSRVGKLQGNAYLGPEGWNITRCLSLYETPLELGSPDPVGEGLG